MGSANRFDGIDEYAVTLIHHKARQLARRLGFSESDQEDLEQEMVLDLLTRLPQFDPKRAKRHTFIARVVEHKIADLLKHRHARKRDSGHRTESLREGGPNGAGNISGEIHAVNEGANCKRIGDVYRLQSDRLEESLDLELAVRALPEDLRGLCELLLQPKTVSEISGDTGIPRPTLYDAIKKIRARFREAGLGEKFFTKSSDTLTATAVSKGREETWKSQQGDET